MAGETVWCLICEQVPAAGTLLRYRDGRPLPRAEGAVDVAVCAPCGEKTKRDSTGATLRFTPYLRPQTTVKRRTRRR